MSRFNPAALVAFFGGLVSTYLFMYGIIPLFQGPIAAAMGGVDLSWLAGSVTAAALYYLLGRKHARRYKQGPRTSSFEGAMPAIKGR